MSIWSRIKRRFTRSATVKWRRKPGTYIDWKPGDPYPTGKETYRIGSKTYPMGERNRTFPDETYEEWLTRLGKVDSNSARSWYQQDYQSRGFMTPENEAKYLKKQGW